LENKGIRRNLVIRIFNPYNEEIEAEIIYNVMHDPWITNKPTIRSILT